MTALSSSSRRPERSERYSSVSGRSAKAASRSGRSLLPAASTAASTSCATPSLSSGGIELSSTTAAPARIAPSSLRSSEEVSIGASRSRPSTTPACRAASVQPPWTTGPPRPVTARSVRASSARPMPAPTRSWGGTVQIQPERGRTARAASPPETSATPEAIRTAGVPARGARRAASIAATGITVTTSPARAGDIPQPSTSSSTTRKSAATRPAESRKSAAFAATCGRSAGSGRRCARSPRTAVSVASATGTWARKIDSQPKSSVRTPPSAGPSAAPATPAVTQMRAARASLPVTSDSRSSAAVTRNAAPAACTQRAPTRLPKVGASPHASDAAANTSTPETNAPRGRRRATNAAGTASSANARLKAVSVQDTAVMPTSNSRRISGSASVTIDESASARPMATPSRPARMGRVYARGAPQPVASGP